MNRDEMIQMAERAGFFFHDAGYLPILHTLPREYSEKCFERFAHKIIADFLARTGQYVTNDASREAAMEQARAEERAKLQAELEQARAMAATAEKWRGLATAKFGDGRTVQEIQREAAEEEREACAKVAQSFEESGMEWALDAVPGDYIASAIRARGQK